jgi:glycosyltransferase involved in cell wall biosynthesis
MPVTPTKLLMGIYFYPRGGSAHVCRALAHEFERNEIGVTVLSGSRSDLGEHALARNFYAGLDLRTADFTPALQTSEPVRFPQATGVVPMHGSYEDRPGAEDPVLASLDDEVYENQVEAWILELERAGAAEADLLYLHHLTPLNEAAARAFPELPVLGHVHGTELLMLEQIAAGPPPGWSHAGAWATRIREWAAELDPARFTCAPNGFDPGFAPRKIDRPAHWRRHLVERPQGWRPGAPAGSVAYRDEEIKALEGTVLIYVGRFTEIKRLPLLIEAFAEARQRCHGPVSLVLLGGHPEEWEGEHPIETIERLGCPNVFLAGWHSHADLPRFLQAADLLVHASAHEQFGQVLVEAMACELPVVAVDGGGPATIVDDPETGWLVPPDDADALARAIVAAVNDPEDRRLRGQRARGEVVGLYSWDQIGRGLAAVAHELPRAATQA